jgi:hypothetical protein
MLTDEVWEKLLKVYVPIIKEVLLRLITKY